MLFLENDDPVVKVYLEKNESKIPIKLYSNSAGYDLSSGESVTVRKWSREFIDTKIRFDIPKGFYGEIKPRSGLAIKNGVLAFNGTVDSGYSGNVFVIVFNNSDDDFIIEKGFRIAQIIFKKCHSAHFHYIYDEQVDFSTDGRGAKGFGSSGV